MSEPQRAALDWDGPLSPPRRNGELVFDAMWESRIFGMTMTLYEGGCFDWDEFRARLIKAMAAWEHAAQPGAVYRYWDCWLAAFEQLMADKGLCSRETLDARTAELAARPHGHDHVRLEPSRHTPRA